MTPKQDEITLIDRNEIRQTEIFPEYFRQLKFLIPRFIKIFKKSEEEEKELIKKNKIIEMKIVEFLNKNKPIIQQDQSGQ